MTLHPVREEQLLAAPVRVLLGVGWLAAARAAGAPSAGALLAFAGGALLLALVVFVPDARGAVIYVGKTGEVQIGPPANVNRHRRNRPLDA